MIYNQSVENLSPVNHAISGFLAGFFSSLTLCPTELVKCRLQALRESAPISSVTANGTGAQIKYVSNLQIIHNLKTLIVNNPITEHYINYTGYTGNTL